MRIIGIGGEPGTGKSTLVVNLIRELDPSAVTVVEYGLLRARFFPQYGLTVLGIYDGSTFGGTDKLAMNVHADAKGFLQTFAPDSNATVLFEGDRLFGESFVKACREVTKDCHWVILEASNANKKQRRVQRGSNQDATWLKGRTTRLMRLQTTIWPVEIWANNTEAELEANVQRLATLILEPLKA